MILAALNDYYARLRGDPDSGIPEPGYSPEKVSYAIVLNIKGEIVAVDDIQDTSGKNPVPRRVLVPQKPPGGTSNILPKFLWGNASYVLGVSAKSKRSEQENAAFKEFQKKILKEVDDDGARAILAFYEGWRKESFISVNYFSVHGERLLDDNINFVFRLDGDLNYMHQRREIGMAWLSQWDEVEGAGNGECLVTGENGQIVRVHPPIKLGRKDAQSSGVFIVSFNKENPAFSSYGKEQGENAPISKKVAFSYTAALNHLLRQESNNRQRLQIGDATVVFWAQANDSAHAQATEDLFAAFIDPRGDDGRETGKLHDALEKVRQGIPLHELDPNLDGGTQIFVLGLAPNASRLSIRFWETGTLQQFAERLAWHFRDLELQPLPWSRPPTIRYLVEVTGPYRRKGDRGEYDGKAVSPLLAGEMTRAVLTGYPYPRTLLTNLIMRMRADGEISGVRVALCKGVLARTARLGDKQGNQSKKGVPPVSLDQSNTDPGYLLGRLFSVLENVQKKALGDKVNATIRDRYYGAASATPASVFPVLLRNVQHHLSKVRKDKPHHARGLENEIGEIIDLLGTAFPKSLGIEAQGHFAIGYYHQTKARFAGKEAQEGSDDNDPEGDDQ